MRKFILILSAIPLMAMSAPPSVPASNQPVPVAEYNRLVAVQACVVRNYDLLPQTIEARRGVSAKVDYVSSQTERARQAYQRNNLPVFSEARANVARTVVELGYPC